MHLSLYLSLLQMFSHSYLSSLSLIIFLRVQFQVNHIPSDFPSVSFIFSVLLTFLVFVCKIYNNNNNNNKGISWLRYKLYSNQWAKRLKSALSAFPHYLEAPNCCSGTKMEINVGIFSLWMQLLCSAGKTVN